MTTHTFLRRTAHIVVVAAIIYMVGAVAVEMAGANTVPVRVKCARVTGTLHSVRSGTYAVTVNGTIDGVPFDARHATVHVPHGGTTTGWSVGIDDLTAQHPSVTIVADVSTVRDGVTIVSPPVTATLHCGVPPIPSTTIPETSTTTTVPSTTTTTAGTTTTSVPSTTTTDVPCIPPNGEPDACGLPRTGGSGPSHGALAGGAILVFGAALASVRRRRPDGLGN